MRQAPGVPPVFPGGVEAVYVDAAVIRRGVPVTGLQARHFELRDNGVLQKVEMASSDEVPLDIHLVCDASASLRGEPLRDLQAAARALVARLRPDDRATLLSVTETLRLHPLNDPVALEQALGSLAPGDRTAFRDALQAALVLSPAGRRGLVIGLTDGLDNASWASEDDVSDVADGSNATLYLLTSVLPGGASDPPVAGLSKIAERTGGHLWSLRDFPSIERTLHAVLDAMRNRYLLRYEPQGVPGAGLHEIRVELRGVKGEVHARRRYHRPR